MSEHVMPESAPVPASNGQVVHQPAAGPARIDMAARWAIWHVFELAGVTAPLVPAATVSPWFASASGAVALAWAVHELRARRAHETNDNTEES